MTKPYFDKIVCISSTVWIRSATIQFSVLIILQILIIFVVYFSLIFIILIFKVIFYFIMLGCLIKIFIQNWKLVLWNSIISKGGKIIKNLYCQKNILEKSRETLKWSKNVFNRKSSWRTTITRERFIGNQVFYL